jgi:hypothetical protein
MIIDDLDVFSASVRPTETHAELIVYPNAILSRPITPEGFQTIARRHPQIVQSTCDFQLPYLAARDGRDIRESFDRLPIRNGPRVGAPERFDHQLIVTRYVINVKRDYLRGLKAGYRPESRSLRI